MLADLLALLVSVVLVTGGTGYLGLHCVKALLEAGYKVTSR